MCMSALRASFLSMEGRDPDLTVGAITFRPFGPQPIAGLTPVASRRFGLRRQPFFDDASA